MNTSKHSPGDDAHCLAAVMLASCAEIYLIDAATLRLVDANRAACANLQYGIDSLRSMTLQQIAPQLSRDLLDAALAHATDGVGQLSAEQRRSDGSRYRVRLRLTRSERDGSALIVAIGSDDHGATQDGAHLARWQEQLDHAREQERTQERSRIARDIHDELGGNLAALKMALAMLDQHLPAQCPQLQQRVAYLDALVDRSIDAMHDIVLDLRPGVLDFGIVAALESHLKQFEAHTGVHCVLTSNLAGIELDPDQASALFRICQEALTNSARHAKASRIGVSLVRTRHHLSLKIADNGRGMVEADRAKPASFGLRGMMERAKALKGTLTLTANADGGTTVAIKIATSVLHNARHAATPHRKMNRRYP